MLPEPTKEIFKLYKNLERRFSAYIVFRHRGVRTPPDPSGVIGPRGPDKIRGGASRGRGTDPPVLETGGSGLSGKTASDGAQILTRYRAV